MAQQIEAPDGIDFAESAVETAKSIGETVERTGRVTPGQRQAVRNIREGVERWCHESDD